MRPLWPSTSPYCTRNSYTTTELACFTDGFSSTDELIATFYISEHSIRKVPKISHPTSSTAAELSVLHYALERIRLCQSANWVFLADSRAAVLSLNTPGSKSANPLLREAIPTDEVTPLCINRYQSTFAFMILKQRIR